MAAEKTKHDAGQCLKPLEVEWLASGRQVAAADEDRIAAHLAECQACREAVQQAALRGAGGRLASSETGLASDAPSQQSQQPTLAETKIDPAAGARQPVSLMFAFLAPAELPDELGRLGGYRVLRVIGEGGMGVVFEAEDPQLHRRVAIKVLKPQGLEDPTRERFLQEARLAASLNSPRIVTIHQIGEDRGCPFIVMELLNGESLDALLRRRHTLTVGESLRIAREVAEGLALAHENGLIHRDIKPANIWLEKPHAAGDPPNVKLLDFGIARLMESGVGLTMEGRIVGTPSYLSPEQAYSEPLDGQSDLFSLGCVLYAMLAGHSPFERANTMLSIRAVLDEKPQPLAGDLPKPVLTLVDRLLSKDPQDRPASARQVADEIRLLETVYPAADLLRPTLPTAVRGKRRDVRHRVSPAGWAGIAAVVLAAVVGIWMQSQYLLSSRELPTAEAPPGQFRDVAPGASTPATPRLPSSPQKPAALQKSAAAASPVSEQPPLKIGIVQSLSGPMFASERPLVDAWLFAIDEINQAGGVLGGRKIQPLVRDGKSYDDSFADQARRLIVEDHVATLFGCWRSSCRKSVEEVCRRHDHLLVYPVAYEGLEQSPHVIYMGGAPNQQILPSVKWAFAFLNKRKFFLVGTDGVYSRCSHEIIQAEVAELGGKIVGNEYRPLADTDFASIAAAAVKAEADVVINTVVGSGNIALFGALRKAGIKPERVPIISMNVTEEELRTLSARGREMAGDYAAWSYFQSLPGKVNEDFLERFHRRFGVARVVNDPMVAAYVGMHLWAAAVNEARSDRAADIRAAFVRQQLDSPEGLVKINPQNQHAWRMALIGRVDDDFHFEVVWTSPRPLDPQPFPPYRSRPQWEAFVADLYTGWGGHWGPEPAAAREP